MHMQIGRLGSLIGFSIGCVGAGVQMIVPEPKFYGWLLIAIGIGTTAISVPCWFVANYRLRSPFIARQNQDISAEIAPVATAATEKVPEIITAPADIPKKLAAIDSLREILNADMPPWINKGHQLTTGAWWNMALNHQAAELRKEVTAWRDAQGAINGKIEQLRQQNEQFPDIHALSSQTYSATFVPKMEHFVTAILSLPDDPPIMGTGALRFFVEPIAQAAYGGLQTVEQWRNATDRNALQMRQSISR